METSDSKTIVENQEEILSISNLTVFRSGSKVIEDINLSIVRGEFIGIVGPNGSGKSTLIMTILGILKPKSGSIKIYNQLPNSKKIVGKVGWVPQTESKLPTNVQITVKEFISLGTLNRKSFFILTKKDRKKVEDILKVVGLEEYKDTRITNLSGGQRQRAAIGKALASESDLIFMDEPMVGVDRDSRNSIMKLLDNLCHEQNKTIIMISHDLASIKQTVHRMIYLEQNIHFDGPTSKFPELSSLAKLRGIKPTHNEDDFWESSESKEEPIIHLVSNSRGED